MKVPFTPRAQVTREGWQGQVGVMTLFPNFWPSWGAGQGAQGRAPHQDTGAPLGDACPQHSHRINQPESSSPVIITVSHVTCRDNQGWRHPPSKTSILLGHQCCPVIPKYPRGWESQEECRGHGSQGAPLILGPSWQQLRGVGGPQL